MDSDLLVIWGTGLALSVLVGFPFVLRMRRRERATETAQEEALRYGLHEPVSLHPIVDPERCIGTGACADVCPESVLGVRAGQAVAVRPARCIGHGLCERACPMEAIRLVFGTERRGVDLPRVREDFETNVPGLYVVGELGGMGLVANAFEQGRQCVEGIAGGKKKNRRAPAPAVRATATRAPGDDGQGDLLDLVIVGCGPAGLSASLTAMDRGLRAVTLEREDLGGAVRHYPRKKLVMTRPVKVPGYGKLPVREIHKEELIGLWEDIARRVGLEVRTGEVVTGVERIGAGGTGRARGGSGSDGGCRVGPDNGNGAPFRVTSSGGQYLARRVVLAIGRRGVPRKLGVPGEDSPWVAYSLREPEAYIGDRILVVGGGDSAVEAALALAEQPGNEVRLSYRGAGFSRVKSRNLDRVEAAVALGALEVLWQTSPVEIGTGHVRLGGGHAPTEVPADHVFVFIGGELPTPFLRACGVEIETRFGTP